MKDDINLPPLVGTLASLPERHKEVIEAYGQACARAAIEADRQQRGEPEYRISACYFPKVGEVELSWERQYDGAEAHLTFKATPDQGKRLVSVIDPCVYYTAAPHRTAPAQELSVDAIGVLKLALEYWADRQQRYRNRAPVWVQEARDLLARQRRGEPVTSDNISELLTAIQLFGSRKRQEGAGLSDPKLQAVRSAWDEVYRLVQVVAAPQSDEPVKTLSDDNSLTIAYMCGYNDAKRSTTPEGWKLVPVKPDWDMEMEGIKKLLQCTNGELECIDGNLLDSYRSEVSEIFCAMLAAAPKFGEL